MRKWSDLDLPKGKEKHAKAMMYRSRQGLKKELKNIDSEYSKALCNVQRDLEQTRNTLKTLRITQKQVRLDYSKHKHGTNFSFIPPGPKPPLQRLRRASTVPLECDLLSNIVKRRQHTKTTILQKLHSRKMLVMKLDGRKEGVKQEKQEGGNEEGHEEGNVSKNIQDLEMNDKSPKESELLDSTEALSTIFSPSEVARNLKTISAESRGDESKVEDTSILTIHQGEESGNESDEPSSPGSEDEQVTGQETSVKQLLGNSWSNDNACEKETLNNNLFFFPYQANISTLSRGKHVKTRRASSPNIKFTTSKTETVLNKSKTGFFEGPTSSLTRIQEPNQDITITPRKKILTRRGSSPALMFTAKPKDKTADKRSLTIQDLDQQPQQKGRTRRASSPNLMFTPMPKDTSAKEPSLTIQDLDQQPQQRVRTRRASSPNLMFTAMQQETDQPRLTSIHELALGGIFTEAPSTSRQRSGRRSSIAVMTGVANSFVSELPSSKFPVTSLPEPNESLQSFGGKYNRRGSVQESNVHDSLRKISRRLNVPLTGAQLEKRLQAHRVDANVASSQTPRIAYTPERKAPNELDMNDLEECRYIRRPIRK